jgi:predicted HTH domain antitoxin
VKLEIELDISEDLVDKGNLEQELSKELILRLFADHKIAAGQATRLLGLTRLQFLDLLRQRGIPSVVYTFDDWREDLNDWESFRQSGPI